MPATCASCDHPQVREINHRIRENRPLTDISRWLAEQGTPITRQALARHAKQHLGQEPQKGRRPVSGDFLESVRDAAHEALASGELNVTLKDGIQAQRALDARQARDLDRDIWAKVTIALTGGAIRVELPVPRDPELDAIEGEFRELLTAG